MTLLISPQTSGKVLGLLIILTFVVFLPTWIITHCIYHPEELGVLKVICGPPNNTTNNTLFRHRRNVYSESEGTKTNSLTENMLILKFKYSYAQKSGYDRCWICSKLHPSTTRIPLMAVPLNIIFSKWNTPTYSQQSADHTREQSCHLPSNGKELFPWLVF